MTFKININRAALKFAVIVIFCLFSCVSAQHRIIPSDKDVQIDPAIIHGRLSNGFQYILMKNFMPENRMEIHLNVFAGSMNETDEQQGLAHFMEHMVFNGSKHFKPGELIKYFQSIGMDFGADANAHTSFYNTVYDLSLPDTDRNHINKAFIVIQDYASGALLLNTEIDRERGVILAEKRLRDSVSFRTFKKSLAFELPGALINKRFPIGMEKVIKTADQKCFKAYYDRWYRPDNMALVVVGDFDIKMVEAMIKKRFSKMTSRSHGLLHPISMKWKEQKGLKAFYHYEPEAGSTDITIETISRRPFEYQTLNSLKKTTLDHIATTLLQNRLSRMVHRQTAAFSEGSTFSGLFLHHIFISAISAKCDPDKWEKSLYQIEKTLRQALGYGFTKKELNRVKADFISFLEKDEKQAESRKNTMLSQKIISAIQQKDMILSPAQRKNILMPYIQSVSLQDVFSALKNLWSKNNRKILVTGNAKIQGKNPQSIILNVYKDSLKDNVDPYEGFKSKTFPYLELPKTKAGIRLRKENIKDLGITAIDFSNNIRLNLKPNDYKKNEFLFKVCFGQGKKSEPLSKPGLAFIAESVVQASGLGRLDIDQLDETLAGKNVHIGFGINENYFYLSGAGEPGEAELIFQLIYHYFNDPGYRKEALNLIKTKYKQQYTSLLRTTEGIMQIKGDLFLGGNDSRFGLPRPEQVDSYTLNDIKDWLNPNFKDSSVEISITGDFNLQNMIRLASKYMGAFKKRKKFINKSNRPVDRKIYFPEGRKLLLNIDTKIDSGSVHVAFLTDDFWNIRQTRRLNILSRVFSERLRVLIREKLGETYSPYVYNDASMIFDHYGVLQAVVNVKPERYKFVYQKIKEIVQSLATGGISKSETDLALKPVLNHLKVYRKTNGYWLNSVMANSATYPQKFEWANNMEEDYKNINSDDLTRLARKYLKFDKSALVIIKAKK